MKKMRNLTEIREDIDDCDKEIVKLLEKRMGYSREVAEYKKANGMDILDTSRENQVLASRADMLADPNLRPGIYRIFQQIMAVSREEQARMISGRK